MRSSVKISHPSLLFLKEVSTKGKLEIHDGRLKSFYQTAPRNEFCSFLVEIGKEACFNMIEIEPIKLEEDLFPEQFRIEISHDGVIWEPILQEFGFRKGKKPTARWDFSLTSASFLKFVGKPFKRVDASNFGLKIGNFKIGIAGVSSLQASSELDRLKVKENVLDTRKDYGWATKISDSPVQEFLILNLGSIQRVEEIRLLSGLESPTNFPEKFVVYRSEDDITWHQILEEPMFLSEPGTWYRWKFLPINLKYLKIVIGYEEEAQRTQYQTEITEIELYAIPDSKESSLSPIPMSVPYSTVLRSGVVRFAVDGEAKEGVAVQGNDRRLRDATTDYKGIVELASDGEARDGVVVQGNDKRLKTATESQAGLVRLARNGEAKPEAVVQSTDDRLKPANTQTAGIVELAEDLETRPGVVVQGNDSRLKKATKDKFGLVILSNHNESLPDKVVTGDDPRLKDATTESKGILRFAKNGEESSEAAVQGNDRRLKDATTESKGIVELALDGESKEGVVVQGNDKRLKLATFEDPGIVTIAKHGVEVSGKVVSSDDPRLKDSRSPLPHTHEYAPLNHDFNSHTGHIFIEGETEGKTNGFVPPAKSNSVISGKNNHKNGSGITGIGKGDGVTGFGQEIGVSGLGVNEAGILGLSLQGSGGVFSSGKDFGITILGNGYSQKELSGSGKAIHAIGNSLFEGVVRISSASNKSECIAKIFRSDKRDVVSPGDLLVSLDESGRLGRSKHPYSTNVIGVCVPSSLILFGDEKLDQDQIFVALYGVVSLNVDSTAADIQPGDLLVSGLVGGHAIKADPNKLKPGMLVGKALEPSKRQKGPISVILFPS